MKKRHNGQKLMDKITKWSDSTFGENREPIAPLSHLSEEVEEAKSSPYDDEEYADIFMLLLDAYRMRGKKFNDLLYHTFHKLEKNKNRNWGKPNENGVVKHIKK